MSEVEYQKIAKNLNNTLINIQKNSIQISCKLNQYSTDFKDDLDEFEEHLSDLNTIIQEIKDL